LLPDREDGFSKGLEVFGLGPELIERFLDEVVGPENLDLVKEILAKTKSST